MKKVKKIIFCSLFIVNVPINTATITVNFPSIEKITQEKKSVLPDKNSTENILKQPRDDKAVKLGADLLTCIAHLCFLYCLIKIIYQDHNHEIYQDIVHAK